MTFEKRPNRLWLGRILYPFVLLPGGHTAADMALPFVLFQYQFYLLIERLIALGKPLLQVFMDGGFGNTEVFGGGANRGTCLDDVHS